MTSSLIGRLILTSCGSDLVAAVLVEDDQEDGHDHDDADHDDGVEDGVEEAAADRRRVLGERRVDPAGTNMAVSCERRSRPCEAVAEFGPTAAGPSSPCRS